MTVDTVGGVWQYATELAAALVAHGVDTTLAVIGPTRGETATDIFTVGNARPLDQALQHATTEMLAWLTSDYGLSVLSASHLLGQVVRYDVGNVFDPAYTMVCRVAKGWLRG